MKLTSKSCELCPLYDINTNRKNLYNSIEKHLNDSLIKEQAF